VKNKRVYNALILSLGLLIAILVGGADYLTGYRLSFSIFYLIPISLVTWKAGKYPGYIVAVASAVTWYIADLNARGESLYDVFLYWNAVSRLAFFFIIVIVISKNKSGYSSEQAFARTDPLTGARNRRAFTELLEKEIGRYQRFSHPFSVAYIDCDNFKAANDTLGHRVGDLLLQEIVRTVQSSMRTMDVFARLGGDEFVMLMPETEEKAAGEAMQRMRDLLQKVMDENGWPVTLSVGISTFHNPVNSVEDVIEKADTLMYSVKNSGKNRIVQGSF